LAVAIVQYPQEKKPSMPVGGVGVDWWSNTAFQHFLVMSFFKGRLDLNLFPPSFRSSVWFSKLGWLENLLYTICNVSLSTIWEFFNTNVFGCQLRSSSMSCF
jgi:hypothetical protein